MNENSGFLIGILDRSVIGDQRLGTIRAGVDRVELEEFRRILAVGGDEFLKAVYTTGERAHCCGRLARLATRFAAKEAASKALGTGFRGISPREIEVVSDASGQPHLQLRGRARDRADALGIVSISVSLSHTSISAEAFVLALAGDRATRPALRKEKAL